MKFQDSSFNGLKVTVGTKSVTHAPTHARTHARSKSNMPHQLFQSWGHNEVGVGEMGLDEMRIDAVGINHIQYLDMHVENTNGSVFCLLGSHTHHVQEPGHYIVLFWILLLVRRLCYRSTNHATCPNCHQLSMRIYAVNTSERKQKDR